MYPPIPDIPVPRARTGNSAWLTSVWRLCAGGTGVLVLIAFVLVGRSVTAQAAADVDITPATEVAGPVIPEPDNADDGETDRPQFGVLIKQKDRLWSNFRTLMGQMVQESKGFVWRLLTSILLWGLGGLIAGALIGFLIYYFLLRTVLEFPWRWYRYVKWMWPFMLVVCLGASIGLTGVCYGVQRCCNYYINEQHVIERVVIGIWCALTLEEAELDLPESLDKKAIDDVSLKVEDLSVEMTKDYDEMLNEGLDATIARILSLLDDPEDEEDENTAEAVREVMDRVPPGLQRRVREYLISKLKDWTIDLSEAAWDVDFRLLLLLVHDPEQWQKLMTENPEAAGELLKLDPLFGTMRKQASLAVDGTIVPIIVFIIVIGITVPAVPVAVGIPLHFLVYSRRRKREGA